MASHKVVFNLTLHKYQSEKEKRDRTLIKGKVKPVIQVLSFYQQEQRHILNLIITCSKSNKSEPTLG